MTDIPEDKFKLWFFRDLSSDQRKKLFGVFDMPMDQLDTHGSQALALRHLFSAETVTSADCSGLLPCAICGLDADALGLSASRLLDKPEAVEAEPVAYRHRLVGMEVWNLSSSNDMKAAREFELLFPDKIEIEPLFALKETRA